MAWIEEVAQQVSDGLGQLFDAGGPAAGQVAPPDPAPNPPIDIRTGLPVGEQPPVSSKPPTALFMGSPVPAKDIPSWYHQGSWSNVWHAIFGGGTKHPNPAPLTQAQINAKLSVLLGSVHAEIGVVADWVDHQDQFVQEQIQFTRAEARALNNGAAAINAQAQTEILNLLAAKIIAAENQALGYANGYTDAKVSLEARARVALGDTLTRWLKDAERASNAEAANAEKQAQLYARQQVDLEAKARELLGQTLTRWIVDTQRAAAEGDAQVANQLHGEVANGVGQAELYARSLIPGAIGTAVTLAVGQVAPQLAALAAEADECLKPLCDTVTPNAKQLGKMGDLLKGLEGLGVAGLLFGLVVEAATDPQRAAGDIVDTFGWTSGLATGAVNDVMG